MKTLTLIICTILLFGCQTPSSQQTSIPVTEEPLTVFKSFLGNDLGPKVISDSLRSVFEEKLAIAKSNLDANPDSLDLIIWHGRRLAYLGRHAEAIQAYTDGLAKYPKSYRLRRHRGHRYITTRQINMAIADYELAAFNSTGQPNNIEPDGLPNSINQPLGNNKFNIYYHFGLAHYLNGRYDKAVSAYNKCMEFSDNDDLKAATSYWLYMSAKRVGNDELAKQILEAITSDMEMVENDAYFDLLLLFKGESSEKDLLEKATLADGQLNPTVTYGIGNWYLQNGRVDDARNLFWKALESPQWEAFGYIATEADISNMATSTD